MYDLDRVIRKVPDFPRPGVLFYDVTSILTEPAAFAWCMKRMGSLYRDQSFDAVAAIESRGFVFAAPFALQRRLPLILIRKKGKLPGETYSVEVQLEYGTDVLEVHVSDVRQGARVLLVDDLIATGGTAKGAVELLSAGGAHVDQVFGVIGLPFLRYQQVLGGVEVSTLITYEGQ